METMNCWLNKDGMFPVQNIRKNRRLAARYIASIYWEHAKGLPGCGIVTYADDDCHVLQFLRYLTHGDGESQELVSVVMQPEYFLEELAKAGKVLYAWVRE